MQVLPSDSYFAAYGNADEAPQAKLLPRMLLLNAVQMNEPDIAPRLVQALLAQKAPLEEVWQESGETALLMAVADDDVEVSVCHMPLLLWFCVWRCGRSQGERHC